MKVSFGSIFGFFGGVVVVSWGILTSFPSEGAVMAAVRAFLDFPSFLIVFMGSYMAMFIAFDAKLAGGLFRIFLSVMFQHRDSTISLKNEVGRTVQWAYIVQKTGLQGLENEAGKYLRGDKFLAYGVDLVVTGYTGNEVREMLSEAAEIMHSKSNHKVELLKQMASFTPAFGMLGTLIGLIVMLGNMDGDPSAIGKGMAVALITTLYGIILARIFFLPASVKIAERENQTLFRRLLLTESLALLAERKSPRYIQDRMNAYLDPENQFQIDRDFRAAT